ncbi:MAG: ferredoxin family protein [Bacteroidales bacterium]
MPALHISVHNNRPATSIKREIYIFIDSVKCSNCSACTEVCSRNVFLMKEHSISEKRKVIVANPQNCTGCLRCMSICKQQAIEVIRFK